ncbi:MAG: DUF3467 domain-containing protein [Planctomycetes bacterium]|nr:DUF3467 domain-containing protein [Planctomycetota bacterium]
MADEKKEAGRNPGAGAERSQGDAQGAEAAGQRRLRVQLDERNLHTSYANAFRTSSTAEEVILDLGLNMQNPAAVDPSQPEILFQITDRIILNFYSAKRLVLTLGQHIRRHEEQFGELEVDADRRRRTTP